MDLESAWKNVKTMQKMLVNGTTECCPSYNEHTIPKAGIDRFGNLVFLQGIEVSHNADFLHFLTINIPNILVPRSDLRRKCKRCTRCRPSRWQATCVTCAPGRLHTRVISWILDHIRRFRLFLLLKNHTVPCYLKFDFLLMMSYK